MQLKYLEGVTERPETGEGLFGPQRSDAIRARRAGTPPPGGVLRRDRTPDCGLLFLSDLGQQSSLLSLGDREGLADNKCQSPGTESRSRALGRETNARCPAQNHSHPHLPFLVAAGVTSVPPHGPGFHTSSNGSSYLPLVLPAPLQAGTYPITCLLPWLR